MIMNLFEIAYCTSDSPYDDVAQLYQELRRQNAETAVKQTAA
jgi:hypothetical protein